ncbi:MAG: glycosyltransferase [Lautropia sp.]
MKFSIVTCTRNSIDWIDESIGSVDAQQGVEIERVFVDGSSTDGTLERLASFAQGRADVRLLRDVGGGIARAMNAGVEAASGDVIAHLHSDDVYLGSDALSKVAAVFAAKPDTQWVVGRCAALLDGRIEENRFETKPYSWRELVRANIVPHPSTFIRRPFFLASGGFSTELRYAMDYDLWLRLARESAPVQIPDYLAAFRFHDDSASTANPWPSHFEAFSLHWRYSAEHPVERLEHLARLAVRSVRLLRAIRRGEGPYGA